MVIATNHPEFCTNDTLRLIVEGAKRDAIVVDPWNVTGTGEVFALAGERVRA